MFLFVSCRSVKRRKTSWLADAASSNDGAAFWPAEGDDSDVDFADAVAVSNSSDSDNSESDDDSEVSEDSESKVTSSEEDDEEYRDDDDDDESDDDDTDAKVVNEKNVKRYHSLHVHCQCALLQSTHFVHCALCIVAVILHFGLTATTSSKRSTISPFIATVAAAVRSRRNRNSHRNSISNLSSTSSAKTISTSLHHSIETQFECVNHVTSLLPTFAKPSTDAKLNVCAS